MIVAFKKISTNGIDFEATSGDMSFVGIAKKSQKNLVHCFGKLKGTITHTCDRCANEFTLEVDEEVELFASDGVYEKDEDLLDVMEFFDGFVNFDTILQSELGIVISDYHYCPTCKQNS